MNPTKHTALRRIIAASVLSATIATTAIAGSGTVASAADRPSGPSDITGESTQVVYKPSKKFEACRQAVFTAYQKSEDPDWANLKNNINLLCEGL